MSLSPAKYSSDATQFVQEHVVTEQGHLDMIAKLLDPADRSKLLPAWRVAGWCLGALPTLVSEKALFCTVEAVETFVELHYDEHIIPMRESGQYLELTRLLTHCRDEEIHHKEDAAARWGLQGAKPWYAVAWSKVVAGGSAAAVALCRRV
eukprot:4677-Heterococcus_DN1.PRE.1